MKQLITQLTVHAGIELYVTNTHVHRILAQHIKDGTKIIPETA